MIARNELVLGSRREVATVGLVAGMCGFYASALILASNVMTVDAERAGDATGVGALFGSVASVFIVIAVYVAAVVIVNGVDTVVASRLRHIAVLRLLGADARWLRTAIMQGATGVATWGAIMGTLSGTATSDLTRLVLVRRGLLHPGHYQWFGRLSVLATVTIVLAAAAASWLGSRAVLQATPAQALVGSTLPAYSGSDVGTARRLVTFALIGTGGFVMLVAAALGERTPGVGFFIAAVGAMISGGGILAGARIVVPGLVAAASRLLGSAPASVVAARNAVREPGRTTRSTVGLVIGVTLVTTFATGFAALRTAAHSWDLSPSRMQQTEEILRNASVVMTGVVTISSAIAAVGFVSTMSLGVVQRTQEIGLLRALGFTASQVRLMITKESAALSATAVTFGMTLGLGYGALGAQSLVGFETKGFVWGVPGPVLLGIAVAGVLLVLAASWVPSSRAVAISPVTALRTDT